MDLSWVSRLNICFCYICINLPVFSLFSIYIKLYSYELYLQKELRKKWIVVCGVGYETTAQQNKYTYVFQYEHDIKMVHYLFEH